MSSALHYPVVGVVEATDEPVFRCPECGLNLAGFQAVREHWAWHRSRGEQPDCPYCGQPGE
jgi:hypothetical protein